MADIGARTLDELIGRCDLLEVEDSIRHWKSQGVDFANILYRPQPADTVPVRCVQPQDYGLEEALDHKLIEEALPALRERKPVVIEMEINNSNRTVGAMLSNAVARRFGKDGLPRDTITLNFRGSAGQSFGAFGGLGLTLRLEGDANDYLGKGLSGAKIIVVPPRNATFKPEENVIAGNTLLYGATSGEVYIRGKAGERFAVRNSGARAVVEGVGDHGCEYMTGGRVVVIGPTGRNFAAGMSGGIAYVYDPDRTFSSRCNIEMVELESLAKPGDIQIVRTLLENHVKHTGSTVAKKLLADWGKAVKSFVRVIPLEYKQALEQVSVRPLAEIEVSDG